LLSFRTKDTPYLPIGRGGHRPRHLDIRSMEPICPFGGTERGLIVIQRDAPRR
jgi:hypothetical protein